MRVVNTVQMREADRRTIEDLGIPSIVLMENAGRQVVDAMEAAFDDLADSRVAVLCGRGNNGGDGFVVARTLAARGVDVLVCLVGTADAVRGDARINLGILQRLGVPLVEASSEQTWELHAGDVLGRDVIVDALFGTGLTGPLAGLAETVVADLAECQARIVAVDLPSGLSADSPTPIGPAVSAALTVTLAAPKLPLVMPPGESLVGTLVVADIGIPLGILEGLDGPYVSRLTPEELRPLVPARPPHAHKGTFGHALLVSGSLGKTGAAHLSAMGALRSGAGLVTVGTPATCVPIVASLGAEYMTEALAESGPGRVAAAALDRLLALPHDVVAAGPGLGTGDEQRRLIIGLIERVTAPLVLDADGINVLAGEPGVLSAREGRVTVVTPHPGEMARLLGTSAGAVQEHRLHIAQDFARTHGVYVVLKGHRTLLATPSGRVFINPTGNPGMATGGSGDVLTGMLAAWLMQVDSPEHACQLAVYLHGAAGDLAAADVGEIAMTAGDIVTALGDAVEELSASRPPARRTS
ncbi:MAG: NAD(P)H-hydrate dehydratase [Acidobacteriota bacterium]